MHFVPFQASVGDSPGDELQQQLVDCLPSGCGEVHLHLPHEIAHKGSSICQGEVSDTFSHKKHIFLETASLLVKKSLTNCKQNTAMYVFMKYIKVGLNTD